MKIIFLDIDGVVCTMRSLCLAMARWYGIPLDKDLYWDDIVIDSRVEEAQTERREANKSVPCLYMENWPFDIIAVDLIHKIVREHPDIKFVISSTWRENETLQSLHKMFVLKGMTIPILAFTEIVSHGNRGKEIKCWLDFNKDTYGVTHFCAIDDNCMDIKNSIPDNYVQTLYDNGFTEVEYDKVMKILEVENG